MKKKLKVFITAAEAKAALPAIQSLAKKGIEVHVGSETRCCAGTFSRYAKKRFLYPSVERDPEGFINTLIDLCNTYQYDVLIPVGDVITALVSQKKHSFPNTTAVPVADYKILRGGRDKAETMKMAIEVGVPCPKTYFPEEEDIDHIGHKIEYPVLIKPSISNGARGIVCVEREDDLVSAYEAVKGRFGRCIVQEWIPPGGMQYKADVVFDQNGEMKAGVVYSKLRFYPIQGGSSILNCTVKNDEILDYSERILQAMNWFGFADFDYIFDSRDKITKIMEINPRFPESFRITLAAGVDFAYMLCMMAMGEEVPRCFEYKTEVYSRFLPGDFLWFLVSPERFRTNQAFFKFFGKDLHYYLLSADDPGPFFGYLLENLSWMKLKYRLIRKMSDGQESLVLH